MRGLIISLLCLLVPGLGFALTYDSGGSGLPADGYASTYVNTTGDTMTGQLTVSGASVTITGNTLSVGDNTTTTILTIDGQTNANISINLNDAGTTRNQINQNNSTWLLTFYSQAGWVFNEDASASDFRIESTNKDRMFYLLPANDAVMIGGTAAVQTSPSGPLLVVPPTAQTITAGSTVTANGCGTLKLVTSAGAVTTDTTDTFTAPSANNAGCIMQVCNSGSNNITLDTNARFKSFGGLDVVLTADDCVSVGSTGASGVWYQLSGLEAN